MEKEDYQTNIKSKYNEAGFQISRLDTIWKSCHIHRKLGRLNLWNIELDSVWTELSGDTKHIKPIHEKIYSKLNQLIVNNSKDKNKLYQILLKKEIFLRRLQNMQGKGSAYYEDEDDFD